MVLSLLLACKPTPPLPPPPSDSDVPAPCLDLPDILHVPLFSEDVDQARAGLQINGTGTVRSEGPFTLNREGEVELDLPATLWIGADALEEGRLWVMDATCGDAEVRLQGVRDPGLSAVLLPGAPGHSWVNAFGDGATIRAALDPARWPRLRGSVDVYRVERGAWTGELVDVRGAPSTVEVNGLTIVELGTAQTPPSTPLHHDIVVDLDRDGRFSPGDLLDGGTSPGLTVYPDLSEGGPHLTENAEISVAFFRTQRVYWPVGLDVFDSPRPVVVISHGNGHQYDWYDDLQEHLASWGYVVMSHRSDTEPGIDAAATTLIENTDLFLTFPGEVHPDLHGRIDTSNVAWIGHSRGGEAVAVAIERVRNGAETLTLEAESVRFISGIAPTVFNNPSYSNAGDKPFHLLLGGADGDVTQGPITPGLPFRCELCKSPRLLQGNSGPQGVSYLQGAIHNDFNCCGVNDGFAVNSPKIGRQAALTYTRALYTALLGHYLLDEPHILEFVERMPGSLPMPDTGQPVSVLTIPDRTQGLFLEDFQTEGSSTLASTGATVVLDLPDYFEGVLRDSNITYTHNTSDPMNGMTQSEGEAGIAERGAVFTYDSDVSWEVALPDPIANEHRFLSVRVAQGTRHPETIELNDAMSFSIALVQGDTVTTLPTRSYGLVPTPYRRPGAGMGRGWANEFNTVRIPLVDFQTAGAELSAVSGVRLSFGPSHGSVRGRVAFDDVVLEP